MNILPVKVNKNYQITIPKLARDKLRIKAGDYLIADIQDGVVVLIKEPKEYTNYLQGLHKEIWKDVDIREYIDNERKSWHKSNTHKTRIE